MGRKTFWKAFFVGLGFATATLTTPVAEAASTDVVFKGGATVTSTSGCTGWNPDKQFFIGTYWRGVLGCELSNPPLQFPIQQLVQQCNRRIAVIEARDHCEIFSAVFMKGLFQSYREFL